MVHEGAGKEKEKVFSECFFEEERGRQVFVCLITFNSSTSRVTKENSAYPHIIFTQKEWKNTKQRAQRRHLCLMPSAFILTSKPPLCGQLRLCSHRNKKKI